MTGPELAALLAVLCVGTAVVLGWIARSVQRVEADHLEADIRARAEQLHDQAETETRFAAIISGLIPGDDQP